MKPVKKKVSMTLDEDLCSIITDLAEKEDRSFSQYVNRTLRAHVQAVCKEDGTAAPSGQAAERKTGN